MTVAVGVHPIFLIFTKFPVTHPLLSRENGLELGFVPILQRAPGLYIGPLVAGPEFARPFSAFQIQGVDLIRLFFAQGEFFAELLSLAVGPLFGGGVSPVLGKGIHRYHQHDEADHE